MVKHMLAPGLAAVGLLTALATAVPASADIPAASAAHLALTVTPRTVAGAAGVELDCFPSGGTHPEAAAACGELQSVDGRFDRLRPAAGTHEMCPMLYDPVTVSATGVWRGTPVSYEHTFNNRCEAERATGQVFAFGGEQHVMHPMHPLQDMRDMHGVG